MLPARMCEEVCLFQELVPHAWTRRIILPARCMYKHNCAHRTLNGILKKPMAPTCAISFSATSSCTGSNTGVRPRRFSSKHVDSAEYFDAFRTNFTWLCVCVSCKQIFLGSKQAIWKTCLFLRPKPQECEKHFQISSIDTSTRPLKKTAAQQDSSWSVQSTQTRSEKFQSGTFTDLSSCYVIEQGTYPGFIRHAPLEIHALLVDWLQPQKNQEVPVHNILTRKLPLRESNLNHLTNHHRWLSRDREKYFRLHAKKKPFSRGVSLHIRART